MEIDLRQLILLVRRWWFVLVLVPIITAGSANFLSNRNSATVAPTYLATATLLINPVQSTGRLPYSAATYGELLKTKPVLEPVVEELNLPFGAEALGDNVFAEPVQDSRGFSTELLRVIVMDADATRAADIANAVARSFVTYIGEQVRQLTGPSREQLDLAIASTNDQIEAAETEIATLESLDNGDDEANADRIAVLRGTINELRATLSDLLSTAMTMDLEVAAAQSQVTLVDEAVVPGGPIVEQSGINPTIPAGFAGLILAGALILLLGYLDNGVKTSEAAAAVAGAPVLSTIPRLSRSQARSSELPILTQPSSPYAESVRLLRTNLEFASAARELRKLVVTSPNPAEGKSTVTANLGIAMAQAGLRVVVVDADLRSPSQHVLFGVRNERGLSTLLTHRNLDWTSIAVPVRDVPGLSLMTSGPLPPNPADILSLDRLQLCLDQIALAVDVVLIDVPPVLPVSDSLIVASHADGVILVCRAEQTKRPALSSATSALGQGNATIVGVVLNQKARGTDTYGYVPTSSSYSRAHASPPRYPVDHTPA